MGPGESGPEALGSCRRAVAAASGCLGDDIGVREAGRLCGQPGAQDSLGGGAWLGALGWEPARDSHVPACT